jgi:hypothetical protein
MAQFFFHFFDGKSRSRDELGLELDTAEQAYLEAFGAAQAMWPELLAARSNPLDCAFDVTDANDAVLFRLPFAELVDACRRPSAPGPESELRQAIEATHVRAQTAKEGICSGFDEVRQSLQEASALLARLAKFEPARLDYRAAPAGRNAAN